MGSPIEESIDHSINDAKREEVAEEVKEQLQDESDAEWRTLIQNSLMELHGKTDSLANRLDELPSKITPAEVVSEIHSLPPSEVTTEAEKASEPIQTLIVEPPKSAADRVGAKTGKEKRSRLNRRNRRS